MKRICFTLQDAPDQIMWCDIEFDPINDGEYNIRDVDNLAILIYEKYPQLKKCNRRIKALKVVDEEGSIYKIDDIELSSYLLKQENDETDKT